MGYQGRVHGDSRTELVQHAGSAGARFPRCRLSSGSSPGLPWPRTRLCRYRPSLRRSCREAGRQGGGGPQPSSSRWPRLAARTPSVILCHARERLRTLLRLVLRPLLLLFCLWDFPSDTPVLVTTVLDSLPSPMPPLPSPRLRSPSTSLSPRRRLLSCSPPVRMPGDSEYLVPKLYLSKTVRLLVYLSVCLLV